MKQELEIKPQYVIPINDIPRNIYNRELSEEQRERLASGKQTGLIKDIIIDGTDMTIDARLSAKKNRDGNLVITYDHAEKQFRMPNEILGVVLSNDDKDKMFNGELLMMKYKGDTLFVGMDKELRKITVKSAQQIGIPSEVSNYKLDDVDKYYLANGNKMDTRFYKTNEGDYFTAKLSLTEDKKGLVFSDINFVQKENAAEIEKKYNVDKTIKDESFMLPPVRIPQWVSDNVVAIDTKPAEIVKKIVTSPLEKGLQDTINDKVVVDPEIVSGKAQDNRNNRNTDVIIKAAGTDEYRITKRDNLGGLNLTKEDLEKRSKIPVVSYLDVKSTGTGFNIKATEYFAPYTLKGVKLTEEQRTSITDGKPTLVEGMNINNSKTDAYVTIKKDGTGISFDFIKGKKSKDLNKNVERNI